MVRKVLERAAFIGGRLFQAGDEVEVATSNPSVLIPASSSPIGNLTLEQVAIFLRYKAEEAGADLEDLIWPEGFGGFDDDAVEGDPAQQPSLIRAGDPVPTEFNVQVTPAEGRLDTVDGVIVADGAKTTDGRSEITGEVTAPGGAASDAAASTKPTPPDYKVLTSKADLIGYIGPDAPSPDNTTVAAYKGLADAKYEADLKAWEAANPAT